MNLQPLTDHIGLLKLMQEAGGVNVKPSIDLLEWCKDTIISQNQAYLDKCQEVERLNKVIENYDLAGIEIRNDALEEAAEIAEEMHHGLIDRDFDKGSLTQQVAWEIRALKDKQ